MLMAATGQAVFILYPKRKLSIHMSKLTKLQLNVPNMACGSCAKTITSAVKAVDQTAQVEADPKTKQVTVETNASEATIREAIKGAGYAIF